MKKFLNKSLLTAAAVLSYSSLASNAPGQNEHNIGLGIQMQTSVNGLSGSGWDSDGKEYLLKLDDIEKKARGAMSMTPFTGYLSYSYMHAITNKFKVGVRLQGHIGKGLFVDVKEGLKDNKEFLGKVADKMISSILSQDDENTTWTHGNIKSAKNYNNSSSGNITSVFFPKGASTAKEAISMLEINADTLWHKRCVPDIAKGNNSNHSGVTAKSQIDSACTSSAGTYIHGDTAAALSWGVNLSAGVKYNITPKFYATLHAGYSLYSYAQAHAERFSLKVKEGALDSKDVKDIKDAYAKLDDNELYEFISEEKAKESSVYTHAITTDLGLGYSITKNFSVEAHVGYEFGLGVMGEEEFYKSGIKQFVENEGKLDEELDKPEELEQGGYEIDTGGLTYGATIVYTF